MTFLRNHGKLLGMITLALLCMAGVCLGPIEENMLALVPRNIRRSVELFEHSPMSQKLIVITQSPTAEQTNQFAQEVQEKLMQAKIIKPWNVANENIVLHMLDALPARFSPQVAQKVAQKLLPEPIAAQLARYYEQLFSFQSLFVSQLMAQDPFYLTEILFDQWAELGHNTQTNYENGFLSGREGTLQAGLYDVTSALSDLGAARQLQHFFTIYQTTLPKGVRVFFMGGLRYTLENASLIKHDLKMITLAGLMGLSGLFLWFFREKRALLIYALILLVLPPAAWVTQLVFGRISGITLGFGSVVAGLSVDYAIYVYFALQQSRMKTATTLVKIRRHLLCNFLTSSLCFVALFFSSVEVFKQIAVFALVALSLALIISLQVFPSYFSEKTICKTKLRTWKIKPLSFPVAGLISLGVLLFGGWGVIHTSFNQDMSSLNSTSAEFVQEKQLADELFSPNRNALLFALGKTEEEALIRNEELSAQLPQPLPISSLFVSQAKQTENKDRWQKFWDTPRRNYVKLLLQEEAQKKGFNAGSFSPFWQWLQQKGDSNVDFSAWYNPVLKLTNNLYAVTNIVPNDLVYAAVADGISSIFVSVSSLQQDLIGRVKKEALVVVTLALLFNLIALWGIFKSFKQALFCFIPVLLGGCLLFGLLALCNIQVNLFGLIFLPLLVGLGIDYAIFQMMKFQSSKNSVNTLYPTRALLAAGLSTLIGFGVLILAKHTVLFMMGLCSLLGIGGAILSAVWILPALWEHYS